MEVDGTSAGAAPPATENNGKHPQDVVVAEPPPPPKRSKHSHRVAVLTVTTANDDDEDCTESDVKVHATKDAAMKWKQQELTKFLSKLIANRAVTRFTDNESRTRQAITTAMLNYFNGLADTARESLCNDLNHGFDYHTRIWKAEYSEDSYECDAAHAPDQSAPS